MSLEQLDDSEFLSHIVWLAEGRLRIGPDEIERLKRMADIGAVSSAALGEAHLSGFNKGAAHERARRRSHMPGDDLDPTQDPVMVTMSRRAATSADAGLSDLLCWCRGFVAALPEDLSRHPMNWEAVREVRIALQRAIEASE